MKKQSIEYVKTMKSLLSIILLLLLLADTESLAQKAEKPYKCGFFLKDFEALKSNYENYANLLGVKKGENVASVGASSGYVEVQVAVFVDSVNWTIQDIDTSCLNQHEFDKVLKYYTGLKGESITGSFTLVIGETNKTNLLRNAYDRVLLVKVYHELFDRESILKDIYQSLSNDGKVVIVERMASKKGQKHGDCKHLALWEPDFLNEMKQFGYQMISKKTDNKSLITYFTFNKI